MFCLQKVHLTRKKFGIRMSAGPTFVHTKLLYCCAENKSKEFPTKLFYPPFFLDEGGWKWVWVEQTVTHNDNGNEQAQP